MVTLFFTSIVSLLTVKMLGLMIVGVVVGLVFGAIPGLTSTMAVAMILPVTFTMDSVTGMTFLMALYVGGISGGLISAILLKIPGTPSSIATCFDGHPMTAKGLAGKALAIGIFASFVGGIIGNIILVFLSPPLAKLALTFGPFEYFSIGIFSLTIIASLASGSFSKGIIAGLMGVFFSTFGMAPVDGVSRFDFGIYDMRNGFALLPVLLGVFAVTDILKELAKAHNKENAERTAQDLGGYSLGLSFFKEMARQPMNFIRSSLIGTFIGILPGIGGSTASILSYSEARRASKHPEKFGTGISDGIIASEASNNAMVGGALVTLVTMGIPGDSTTAILLGGMMIHGLQPGPLLMQTNPEVVYGIFAALFISNILFFVIEYSGIKLFIKVLDIPRYFLYPVIFVMCMVGSYANNNMMFDIYTMILFGVIGYLLDGRGYSMACFVIGFILGPMIEVNLRRALMVSHGSFVPFVTRPISLIFLIVAALSLILTLRKEFRKSSAKV